MSAEMIPRLAGHGMAGRRRRPAATVNVATVSTEEGAMRAVVVHETGGPEVLKLEQVDPPEPGDGELLIRVHAASVNPIDWKYRRGFAPRDLPAVLGNDASGTVELARADGFSEGD